MGDNIVPDRVRKITSYYIILARIHRLNHNVIYRIVFKWPRIFSILIFLGFFQENHRSFFVKILLPFLTKSVDDDFNAFVDDDDDDYDDDDPL